MTKKSLLVFLLFFISSFILYFYKSSRMLTFDADQEYYAFQYVQIFKKHKITLLGIETSIGGMFVGPIYTYFTAFIYWLSLGNPLGIFWITLFIISFQAGLTYWLFTFLKEEKVGLVAGLLTLFSSSLWNKAFSPSVINFLFPLGLLFLFCLAQVIKRKKYIIWLSLLIGISLHLHFSLFLFFPAVTVFFIWRRLINRHVARELLFGCFIVLFFLSPFLLFEIRHKFFISKNLMQFISQRFSVHSATNDNIFTHAFRVIISLVKLSSHYISVHPNILVYGLLGAVLFFFLIKVTRDYILQIIALLLGLTIFFFTLYGGPSPDYYFYFLLPSFIYILASFLTEVSKHSVIRIPIYLFLTFLLLENLQFINKTFNPYNLYRKWDAVKYIKSQSQDKIVKVLYDTDLGLGFGFNYLLDYEKVKRDDANYQEIYQIVIRGEHYQKGVEFREPNSPAKIKVVKLDTQKFLDESVRND